MAVKPTKAVKPFVWVKNKKRAINSFTQLMP